MNITFIFYFKIENSMYTYTYIYRVSNQSNFFFEKKKNSI